MMVVESAVRTRLGALRGTAGARNPVAPTGARQCQFPPTF